MYIYICANPRRVPRDLSEDTKHMLEMQLLCSQQTYAAMKTAIRTSDPELLGELTVEGLAEAFRRATAAQGPGAGSVDTLLQLQAVQNEVDAAKAREREEREVHKMLQKHNESHEALSVQQKMERARQQQQLQSKLQRRINAKKKRNSLD